MTESLDRLWAGWRSAYLSGDVEDVATGADCVLCAVINAAVDSGRNLVAASDRAVVVLNAFPYTSGHVLVLPRRHHDTLDGLDAEEHAALWGLVRDASTAIKVAYSPDGLNVGVNEGAAAGAGLPEHLHAHVLPRWFGDTSFTTTVAGVRVMPETLETTVERLRAAWPDADRPLP